MNTKITQILMAVLTVAVIGLFILVLTKNEKVAYIDTGVLMEKSKQMQSLRKQLEKDQSSIKGNIDTLTSEFQVALQQYEKVQNKMSAKEKQLNQELLRGKQQQLVQYQQVVREKLQSEEQKKTQELLTSINAKIKEYGEKHGYKIILATSGGNIAYGDKGADITEAIINQINE